MTSEVTLNALHGAARFQMFEPLSVDILRRVRDGAANSKRMPLDLANVLYEQRLIEQGAYRLPVFAPAGTMPAAMLPRKSESQNDSDALAAAAQAARRAGPDASRRSPSRRYYGARATAIIAAVVVTLGLAGAAIWYQYGRVQQQNQTEQAKRETLEAFQRLAADAKTDSALDRFDGHIADAQFALDHNRQLLGRKYIEGFDSALAEFRKVSDGTKALAKLEDMRAHSSYAHAFEDSYKEMEATLTAERRKNLQTAMSAVESLAGSIGP